GGRPGPRGARRVPDGRRAPGVGRQSSGRSRGPDRVAAGARPDAEGRANRQPLRCAPPSCAPGDAGGAGHPRAGPGRAGGHPAQGAGAHAPDSAVVVEWRALTVALLDRLAPMVAACLGLGPTELPLIRMLEGGTWAAGREQAVARRGGAPPIRVATDGTLF